METKESLGLLGKTTPVVTRYSPELLHGIARKAQRAALSLGKHLPFKGKDLWYLYELSWLDPSGKPEVAVGELIIPCDSPRLVESKSLKLYLNSLNNVSFNGIGHVTQTIKQDLTPIIGAPIELHIHPLPMIDWHPKVSDRLAPASIEKPQTPPQPHLIDTLSTTAETYQPNPDLLQNQSGPIVTEHLYSNLLRSNCPVTGQPDWAQIHVIYTGPQINHKSLLNYIISYRQHQAFHEYCVERFFIDISHRLQPTALTVWAQYTRRGGIAISPYRC